MPNAIVDAINISSAEERREALAGLPELEAELVRQAQDPGEVLETRQLIRALEKELQRRND